MFDLIDQSAFEVPNAPAVAPKGAIRALVVAASREAGLGALCADADGAVAISPERLALDWPDYVAARARTGGALVVDGMATPARDERFAPLAQGRINGRDAQAGLLDGALVFWLQ